MNSKDKQKKDLMNAFELAIAKTLTKTDLDPLGAAAVLLKLALTIYHDHQLLSLVKFIHLTHIVLHNILFL